MVWWCKRFFTFQSIISIIVFSIIIFDQVYAVFYIERKKKSAEHIFCILYFTNVKKIPVISDPSVSSTTLNAKKLSHKF